MDEKNKIKEEKNDVESDQISKENDTEETSNSDNGGFWKKLGSAVKKAVDCCLEG